MSTSPSRGTQGEGTSRSNSPSPGRETMDGGAFDGASARAQALRGGARSMTPAQRARSTEPPTPAQEDRDLLQNIKLDESIHARMAANEADTLTVFSYLK